MFQVNTKYNPLFVLWSPSPHCSLLVHYLNRIFNNIAFGYRRLHHCQSHSKFKTQYPLVPQNRPKNNNMRHRTSQPAVCCRGIPYCKHAHSRTPNCNCTAWPHQSNSRGHRHELGTSLRHTITSLEQSRHQTHHCFERRTQAPIRLIQSHVRTRTVSRVIACTSRHFISSALHTRPNGTFPHSFDASTGACHSLSCPVLPSAISCLTHASILGPSHTRHYAHCQLPIKSRIAHATIQSPTQRHTSTHAQPSEERAEESNHPKKTHTHHHAVITSRDASYATTARTHARATGNRPRLYEQTQPARVAHIG